MITIILNHCYYTKPHVPVKMPETHVVSAKHFQRQTLCNKHKSSSSSARPTLLSVKASPELVLMPVLPCRSLPARSTRFSLALRMCCRPRGSW